MKHIYTYPTVFSPSSTYTRYTDISTYFNCTTNDPTVDCASRCPYNVPFLNTDLFTISTSKSEGTASAINSITLAVIATPGLITYNGKFVTINFSVLPSNVDCFYVSFSSGRCFEFNFERATLSSSNYKCGYDTLLLESFYPDKDCLNNNYSGGYSNRIRIKGVIYETGTEREEKRSEKGKLISRRMIDNYKLKTDAIPDNSWLLAHVKNAIMFGNNLQVSGIGYELYSDISKRDEQFPFWYIDLQLKILGCFIYYNCD